MCLYMSVPQWLSLQHFFKAINETINHTIDVSFMFIYLKCLSNRSNNNNNKAAIKNAKATANHIVATQINANKNHTIDLNVNVKKRNSFEMFTLHKTCNEIGQVERKLTMQHNSQKLEQLNNQQKQQHYYHNQQHYRNHCQQQHQQQQEEQQHPHHYQHHLHHYYHQHHLHHNRLCNSSDQLQLMNKFKTIPLHI